MKEENGRLSCVLEDSLFEPPPQYHVKTVSQMSPINPSDDDLFSWTLPDDDREAHARDQGKMVDIYEALNAPRSLTRDSTLPTPDSDAEEQLLQRAIEESLIMARMQENPEWRPRVDEDGGTSGSSGVGSSEQGPQQTFGGIARSLRRTSSFEELQAVLDLSRRETEESNRVREEEEEALKKVLELSLQEY